MNKKFHYRESLDKFSIRANCIQKNNHMLVDSIRKIRYDPSIKIGDFILGEKTMMFYVSYRYLEMRPKYVQSVIVPTILKVDTKLDIVVLFVLDEEDPSKVKDDVVSQVNVDIFGTRATLVVSNSYAEAAQIIEEYGRMMARETVIEKSSDRFKVISALAMIKGFTTQDVKGLLAACGVCSSKAQQHLQSSHSTKYVRWERTT